MDLTIDSVAELVVRLRKIELTDTLGDQYICIFQEEPPGAPALYEGTKKNLMIRAQGKKEEVPHLSLIFPLIQNPLEPENPISLTVDITLQKVELTEKEQKAGGEAFQSVTVKQ